RPAARKDAPAALHVEHHRAVVEYTLPSVAEADELVAVVTFPFADDGADDSIEARTVTATGQESNSHFPAPLRPARSIRAPRTSITVVMHRVSAFVAVAALALGALPTPARAASTGDDLSARRDALLARIAAQAQLESERVALEATMAHQDALDAQLQAAAAARKAAQQAQAAASQAVLDRFETDPAARNRHRVATVNQRQIMGRWPFGPAAG